MQTIDPASVTWGQMVEMTAAAGSVMRYPIIAILFVMAVILYRSNITLKFRKTHSMQTLRQQEQYNWPSIMPVIKQDLVNTDINQGPWAMALSPMEFARRHKLLRKDDALLDTPLPSQEMTAGIRRGDAKRVFTLQLGPYWAGFDALSPAAYALAAVFMARINRDRESANFILHSLDKSTSSGKPDFSIARATLRKHYNSELVQEILPRHAYTLTVLASLLVAARNDGVLASSQFLWLKTRDRRLWYMLNSVGRQTPFVEVAGPFAHWRAEIGMGRASLVPMVDEAIKALQIAVKEIRLTPKQMLELEP